MIIQGRLEKKEESGGENDKGKWVRCQYTIDGKGYSTFDKKIMDEFKIGDNVEIETKTSADGKYENMVSMKLLEEQVGSPEKVAESGSRSASFYTAYAKDVFIAIYNKEELELDLMKRAIILVKQAREAFE